MVDSGLKFVEGNCQDNWDNLVFRTGGIISMITVRRATRDPTMEPDLQADMTRMSASPASGRLPRVLLMVCVLASGAAVMLDEFLAVRLLARYFGSALDVWASVISVLLIGLSAGYALGGRLADAVGTLKPIAGALIVAGAFGTIVERLCVRLCAALIESDYAVSLHPYLAAFVVFFAPILALGTVLPQAIRLRAEITGKLGASAGAISSLSTVGSVLGVLLTVHVLLPHVGVRESLLGASTLLILIGAVTWVLSGRTRFAPAVACLCLLAMPADAGILLDRYSAYHHILVEDTGGTRLLRFDSAVQSKMSLRAPYDGGFEYTEFFHVPIVLNPTTTNVLFIGLGGGTGPKAFHRDYPHVFVNVAEIDPEVVDVARRYFALPEDGRLRVTVSDGRVFLQRSAARYGTIIVDAYACGPSGAYIPYQLATQEFFELAWRCLENGGSLAYNVMGVYGGDFDSIVRSLHATLLSVFQAVYAFQAASSINTVFVAQKIDPGDLQPNGTRDGHGWPQDPWLRHPLSAPELQGLAAGLQAAVFIHAPGLSQRLGQFSGIQNSGSLAPIYTDNFAPVDISASRSRGR